MAPSFVDASMVHLIAIILKIFIVKIWLSLARNYKRKRVKKPILASLGAQIFKKFSMLHTVVVPPGETNISKLLTTLTQCRQHCIGILSSQCCPNTSTLRQHCTQKNICAMLTQSAQICFPRKTGCSFKYVW